mmetsp:Transcript_765/g.2426  ORF Transcript_765/g.2426 Transcript_765/m.2426 type:complete len:232 (-) Transcript_765:165-860(-)
MPRQGKAGGQGQAGGARLRAPPRGLDGPGAAKAAPRLQRGRSRQGRRRGAGPAGAPLLAVGEAGGPALRARGPAAVAGGQGGPVEQGEAGECRGCGRGQRGQGPGRSEARDAQEVGGPRCRQEGPERVIRAAGAAARAGQEDAKAGRPRGEPGEGARRQVCPEELGLGRERCPRHEGHRRAVTVGAGHSAPCMQRLHADDALPWTSPDPSAFECRLGVLGLGVRWRQPMLV